MDFFFWVVLLAKITLCLVCALASGGKLALFMAGGSLTKGIAQLKLFSRLPSWKKGNFENLKIATSSTPALGSSILPAQEEKIDQATPGFELG